MTTSGARLEATRVARRLTFPLNVTFLKRSAGSRSLPGPNSARRLESNVQEFDCHGIEACQSFDRRRRAVVDQVVRSFRSCFDSSPQRPIRVGAPIGHHIHVSDFFQYSTMVL